MAPPVRIAALGGLGEIGMNCLVVECEGRITVVDCGLLFPAEPHGVEAVSPDLSWLRERRERVDAVLLTHGHEDHVGALPLLLRDVPAPVYGPRLALAMVRSRLDEAGVRADLREVRAGDVVRPGTGDRIGSVGPGDASPIRAEFVAVTHSIPDACALALETPQGTVFHSGDFKIDEAPLDGRRTDLDRIEALGRNGVRLLLSDSTNADRPGTSPSESAVGPALAEAMAGVRGRVLVTCFSSHLHRIQQVADAARALGRRLVPLGRSMEENVRLGLELGLLRLHPGQLASAEEARDLPRRETCVLVTGTQGEPRSALGRLARGEMPGLDVMPGDRVLLSSRFIPGNEVAIGRAVDGLVARGAEVLWEDHRALHASGHAQEEEQRRLVRLARPEHFVPIHGELRHLVRHAGHAAAEGVAEGRRHVLVDGEVLELSSAGVRRSGERLHAGRVFLQRDGHRDGRGSGDGGATTVGADVVRDRRVLSELGVTLVVLAVHAGSGELARPPVIRSRGVAGIDGREDEVAAELARGLAELPPGARDAATLEREAAQAVRRWFRRTTGPRPPVEVVVLEV